MPWAASESSLLLILTWNWWHLLRFSHGQLTGRPILSHDHPVTAVSNLGVAEAGHAGMQWPPVQVHVLGARVVLVVVGVVRVVGGVGRGTARLGELRHTPRSPDGGGSGYDWRGHRVGQWHGGSVARHSCTRQHSNVMTSQIINMHTPYRAARGTMGPWLWWTGQGSPSQVWWFSIGTDWTLLMEPVPGISRGPTWASWGGAIMG